MKSKRRFITMILLAGAPFLAGCQLLSYSNSDGEKFTRAVFGTRTTLSALVIDTGTNGLRRLELRGYQNDANQALGTVTEAAVRAALRPASIPTLNQAEAQ